MRKLILMGLVNLVSLPLFASSPVDLICSWDNGNGVFLSMNIPLEGDIAYLDKDKLSEYKVDLFDKNLPFNGENHISVANTGPKALPSFPLNDPNLKKYTHGNMHLDSNNEMTFGYYNLNSGVYSLAYGPVRLKIAVPKSVAMDSRHENEVSRVGRAVAVFSNGAKYFATCDLLYNHE
ncbi:hypothetical protein AB1A81_03105 [Bdellovibrio bacteriovorus]|uniref:Uncharacterized protein n=1 Tax=Bdellovibrio bacteriovorus (strain ATCC 15356 / DSM 50701 / NCIMB 9529 / HD100) TaxID=264462 RepID=Q6MQ09_BDEBA|nr:hypothetical protein [Bdellovibrio bacteriovorus]CAE78638.1 hypothetical protein predicted by Glimmer/Critica [Bdellovibrio bacteriovorus HD100]